MQMQRCSIVTRDEIFSCKCTKIHLLEAGPAGGVYSAPLDPLAGFRWPGIPGERVWKGEREKWRGGKGKVSRMDGRKKEGKRGEVFHTGTYFFLLQAVWLVIAARLRKPHDGLFSGTIDALDTVNNTYRITFERAGFGTYSIPDIDVVVCITIIYVSLCRMSVLFTRC